MAPPILRLPIELPAPAILRLPIDPPVDLIEEINPDLSTLEPRARLFGIVTWVSKFEKPLAGDVIVVATEVDEFGNPSNEVARGVFSDIRRLHLEYSLDVPVPADRTPKEFRVIALYGAGTAPPSYVVASLSPAVPVARLSSGGATRYDVSLCAFVS